MGPDNWLVVNPLAVQQADARVSRWEDRMALINAGAGALTVDELKKRIDELQGDLTPEQETLLDDMHREYERCTFYSDTRTHWPAKYDD